MKSIFKLLLYLSTALAIYSCETQNIEDVASKTAVVEGYLIAGRSVDNIKITQSFSYTQEDSTVITLDDLDVYLGEGDLDYLLHPVGSGIYENSEITVKQDKSYRIEFVWEGESISAETYVPFKKEAQLSLNKIELPKIELGARGNGINAGTTDPIEITWDNSEGDYYYIVISNIENDPAYVNENLAAMIEANGGAPRFSFITKPQVSDYYPVDARLELTQYGTHQVIVFRVNPEYAALYESTGSSTFSLTQPPTNIENGLGIFSGVSSDTLYFEVIKI